MKAKRLFVFDMDGVLVDSEKTWVETEPRMHEEMFGEEIARGIGDSIGLSLGDIYKKVVSLGATMERRVFDRIYNETAVRVYGRCTISRGADELVAYLLKNGWAIALLSSAPMLWIAQVLPRLSWRDDISMILSLNEHHELRSKPFLDGYSFLVRNEGAKAEDSVALEDSNPGIAAARAAGLFTIGYLEHLPGGYAQDPADATADTMQDVLAFIRGTISP